MKRDNWIALYWVFCLILLCTEIDTEKFGVIIFYYAFVIANLINVVRLMNKPPNTKSNDTIAAEWD